MKPSEIRELTTEEVLHELGNAQRALFNLRFQRETEQLEKPSELRKAKKDIARFKTILRQRLGAPPSGGASPAPENRADAGPETTGEGNAARPEEAG